VRPEIDPPNASQTPRETRTWALRAARLLESCIAWFQASLPAAHPTYSPLALRNLQAATLALAQALELLEPNTPRDAEWCAAMHETSQIIWFVTATLPCKTDVQTLLRRVWAYEVARIAVRESAIDLAYWALHELELGETQDLLPQRFLGGAFSCALALSDASTLSDAFALFSPLIRLLRPLSDAKIVIDLYASRTGTTLPRFSEHSTEPIHVLHRARFFQEHARLVLDRPQPLRLWDTETLVTPLDDLLACSFRQT
jgi:hypothetical protein